MVEDNKIADSTDSDKDLNSGKKKFNGHRIYGKLRQSFTEDN